MYSSAIYVANTIINRANEEAVTLTHIKLQKLLYLLYARFYALTERPLFLSRFEAWQYGPVLPDIYQTFKPFGGSPIKELQADANGNICVLEISGVFGKSFRNVWDKYSNCSGADLVRITHADYTAWDNAFRKNEGKLGALLKDADIITDGGSLFA